MAQHGHGHSTVGEGHEQVGHVVPTGLLAGVLIALLVLTWATVAVTRIQLGEFNIWIAIGIATVKATLVALYFMHLRWDRPFNGIILIASLIFVGIFLIAALTDATQYHAITDLTQAPDFRGQ